MGSAVSPTSQFFNMIIIVIIVIMIPYSATAQPYHNVTRGASIVAGDADSIWPSPSGEFAFGFQQVTPGSYLLAIWFDSIPEKTIVWSANRDRPVPQGSRIQLLEDGRFELTNPTGQQIWAASLGGSGRVAYAAMLDSGEFMLATNTSAVLWRSSGEPTDTLLPGQILSQDSDLISSLYDKNYTRGRFMLRMQENGDLVLYTRNYPEDDTITAYWSTKTSGNGSQLVFNESGYISVVTTNTAQILSNLSSNGASTSQLHQRLTLGFDGVLRHYVYPKFRNSTDGRAIAWSVNSFYPDNICEALSQMKRFGTNGDQHIRGGVCGYNAFCKFDTAAKKPTCECPDGYSWVDPVNPTDGCKPDFAPQSCDHTKDDLFTLKDYATSDWAFSDYAALTSFTEDECRQACLSDCYCAAAAYTIDSLCVKKNVPLSNGRTGLTPGVKLLHKIPKNSSTTDENCHSSRKNGRSAVIIAVSVLLGSSAFLNLLLLAAVVLFVLHFDRRKRDRIQAFPGVCITTFSYKELEEATNKFNEKLGSGGCSTVYRGNIKDGGDEKVVAVKKLDKIAGGAEQEFKAEVSSISRTNHKNLVQLLGYCDEGQQKLLVYEFMSNGSLADLLFESSSKPKWYRRLQIAFATARALCYLHEDCSAQIIHCDIKPQNVLLDEAQTPKISDFGLAKLLRPDQTRTTTGIRGTRGYVAPEWFRNMPITAKVDVYSFGIMLLELLCCRRHYEEDLAEDEVILSDWAYDCYREGKIELLVSGDEEAKNDIKLLEKLVMIAMWCIQEDHNLRPQMKRVMHMFEGSMEVPTPPNPASFIN